MRTFCFYLVLIMLASSLRAQEVLFITEFMAVNSGTLLDQDGAASDWLEIYNAGSNTVNLAGWHLTDDAANLVQWTFPATNLPAGGFLIVFASGKDRAVAGQQLHTSFQLDSAGEYLALVKPDGVTVAHAYAPAYPPQVNGVSYGVEVTAAAFTFITNGAPVKWCVPLNAAAMPANWPATNFTDAAWSSGLTGVGFSSGAFAGLVQTDAGSAMSNINATALLRVPFTIPEEDLPTLDTLTLRMKYDDGFVAYLNGVEVARRNAPATPAWNSAATTSHDVAAALVLEDLDVTSFIPLLQEGDNVLAIQGLNVAPNDGDFLVLPQLVGCKFNLLPERYYAAPSPGATNSGGALGLVADPQFSVDRGFYDAPFTVALTSVTAGAEIRYTTNGTAPSAVSGTLYTAPLPVSRTTGLRAIATKPGWLSSAVGTHTYVFLGNVLTQSLASAAGSGFPSNWPGTTADYAMDPNVTGPYAAQMLPSLRALPAVFITTSISNLFDATTGIYTHPTAHGVAWERPVSLELVGTNGLTEFQEDCGLRIQGGAFRDFGYTQKKSLRVLFKSTYGAGQLHYDLFKEPGAVTAFDGFVLRAGANDAYSWDGAGTTVQFIRDEFGRRLQLDMGHPAPRGRFVHVYLNGLYWGLYNLVERPNEDFSAAYFGGDPLLWDANNDGDYKNGGTAADSRWNAFTSQASQVTTFAGYQALQGNNADGTRNAALPLYFDKGNYLDYMLLNIWGGNWDWPNKNFWFGRLQTADSTGYKFYLWDFENTMGNNRDRSPLDMVAPRSFIAASWVGLPHYWLKTYAEYKLDFADRVQRYFCNGGLLTPQVLTNRYYQLADTVQPAIVAEAARWGDDNHTPAYGLPEWLAERDWILTNYLPQRSSIVLGQFRSAGLFPAVGAPAFNQWGGAVPAGFNLVLTHTNAAGTIFFTLDGSDPRVPGTGAVAAAAQAYTGPVTLNAPTDVRARVWSGGTWSPIVEAVFYPPQDLSQLALTEIMYHAPDAGTTSGDDLDFIELQNTGTNTLNLSGLAFTAGVTFTFTNGTQLAAGQFCVLARNAAAMAVKYPALHVQGIFTGKLDNGGETLTLSHPLGATVFSVTYNDKAPWPVAADGFGYSLVPINPGSSQAPDKGEKWRASANIGGSPGAADPAPAIPPVVINEVLAHTAPPLSDSIELFNPTATNVNVGGWYLTDDPGTPKKFRIPTNTTIAAGGCLYFTESDFNPTPGTNNSFALNAAGDDVYLFAADAAGQLTGYSHGVTFGATFSGVSFGRYVNSAGEESFPLLTALTFGAPNAGPRIGPVVINEINYHPDSQGDEFVELLNITGSAVPLFDPAHPTNTWKAGGLGYTFPTNVTLGAGQMLLLVATNPASFRAKYAVSNEVLILGPYAGALDNSGENLELQAPDSPAAGLVPYVTVEAVRYNDKTPWPAGADGTGLSLQRVVAGAYGNEPANWIAATPTPGQAFGSGDTDGDGLPDWWELANGTLMNVPDAGNDPDGDGFTNRQEYLAGTNPHDPDDFLKVRSMAVLPTGFTLSFQAASNHTYSVLYKATLTTGMWNKLVDVSAHPTNRTVSVTDPAPLGTARFYRLVTPAQP